MKEQLKYLFKNYFEIAAFTAGLLLLAFMDPEIANGPGLCVFEQLGISFCPGDGLGHSIAYTFDGNIDNAMQSNILGPFAIIILIGRIGYLIYTKVTPNETNNSYYGSND
ncbi:DUF2752 domain-containing protein [Fodinibius halophilus]|uniref:DUF2752 domain-containing protein n=1 Tax=Fodinibius halophilus TaxID=1736908 RepID=A0A6M1T5G9_9BACT|nr:DUF2752 domain-containing protein [Fodinibius halophilus]NGP87893.1 DUF2752 domain-containing protein [Fodinibius halophilus]